MPVASQTPIFLLTATSTVPTIRQPTRTARPTLTPTSIARLDPHWSVPALRIGAGNVLAAGWDGADRVHVRRPNGDLWLSVDGHAVATPTAAADEPVVRGDAPAPDGQHAIAIDGNDVRLYATGQAEASGAAALTLTFGSDDVRWSPDSRRMVLVAEEGLYWWDVAEVAPVQLESSLTFQLSWSPTGDRLAYLAPEGTLKIVTAPDAVVTSPELDLGFYNDSPSWIGPDLIALYTTGAWASETYYIQARTGRLLRSWFNAFALSQSPAFSPDQTWYVLDDSLRLWRGEYYASEQYYAHRYQIVQTVTGEERTLLGTTEDQYLDWVGWSADGSRFWLISRPTSADGLPDASMPFGMLSLDPRTGAVTVVFEQAVFARLTPDETRAWVVFPVRHGGSETLGLDGAVVNLTTGELSERSPVADVLDYPYPADRGLYPSAWSTDGRWLVFADEQGRVGLVNGQTGALTPIATDLALPPDPVVMARFSWASDRHLLYHADRDAWIVDLSALTASLESPP